MHAQQSRVCMHADCRAVPRSVPGLSCGRAYNSFFAAQNDVKTRAERLRATPQLCRHTSSSLQRGRPLIAAISKTDTQTKSKTAADSQQSNGWAWIFGALTLTSGAAVPALYLASHWQQVVLVKVTCTANNMHRPLGVNKVCCR